MQWRNNEVWHDKISSRRSEQVFTVFIDISECLNIRHKEWLTFGKKGANISWFVSFISFYNRTPDQMIFCKDNKYIHSEHFQVVNKWEVCASKSAVTNLDSAAEAVVARKFTASCHVAPTLDQSVEYRNEGEFEPLEIDLFILHYELCSCYYFLFYTFKPSFVTQLERLHSGHLILIV